MPDAGRAQWATVGILPELGAGQGPAVRAVAGSQLLPQVGNQAILAVVLFFSHVQNREARSSATAPSAPWATFGREAPPQKDRTCF